jgi:hypothetical protein
MHSWDLMPKDSIHQTPLKQSLAHAVLLYNCHRTSSGNAHGFVTDHPITRWKSIMFDNKAKVRALVQRVRAFKKQKLAEEAEEEVQQEQQALACAVSTRQYAVVRHTGSVSGRARTM